MSTHAEASLQTRLLLQKFLSQNPAQPRVRDISRRDLQDPVPISAEQKNVWLHAAMAPDVSLYNESITIHRRGSFDRIALEQTLRELVRRHEIWRTAFETVDGELRQIIHPDLRLEIPLVDLSDLEESAREPKAAELATADARLPFDLSRAPLLRARIVRFAPDYHRLYLTLHHIIFDGVSIYRIVLPEIAELYAAYAAGREPGLSGPPLQYGDYAIWRERELSRDNLERELAWWRKQLAAELPALRLPVDRPRPAQATHRGSMETFALSAELTHAVKRLARTEGVTVYVVLLAAFKALLHRYSGQDDIVIGGVTDMRRRPELACTVGYFLNSFALRTQPQGTQTFRDYLHRVQNTVIDSLDASSVPFDRVVRAVQPKREAGAHPIFQVLFSVEPPAPLFAAGWDLTQMDVSVGSAKFDLYLELDERPEGLVGRFLYATDLFDAPTIRRMIGHWTTLLEGAISNPLTSLARLPLLTESEKTQLLVRRNETRRGYPDITVPERFDSQARRTPEAIAVACEGRQWRYRELSARVAELTAQLKHAGVGRESVVAVVLDRNFDMVAGLLASLRAGGAYLPLDSHLPAARLAMFLRESNPAVVLTQSSLLGALPPSGAKTILVDTLDETVEVAPGENSYASRADDLAYLLFTSGSTGKPKAVEIGHRALSNLLFAMEEELGAGAADRLLAVTTLSFDIAALEIFLPLLTGGTLLLASRETATDPARLMALLDQSAPTLMQATPATWRALIATGWRGHAGLKILCGGEALSCELARELLDRCGKLWNVYGPTETTIWSLIHQITRDESAVPIGRPLANTTMFVLDRNGEPVPVGVPGEIYIGGTGLARGYRNDPVQTARKFCIVESVSEERLYRTGDTVRFRPDGLLEFLGRSDNQVKIRGFRVSLEEIEAALAAHPAIAAAAARAVEDSSGARSLEAFVVPKTADAELPDINAVLAQTLPYYMVPSRITTLTSLPLTPNGKLDRAKLPASLPTTTLQGDFEPRNELEIALANIWKRLLRQDSIGIQDNFFEVGGHSLLAAMLAADIRKFTQRELPLAALFHAPTIAQQANLLRSEHEGKFSHLVLLRQGSGWPLYIVHGVFGNVLQFAALAAQLRTERPIYGVQARGADPRLEPHETIVEMAAAYVDEIRAVQPAGPYAIGGYSFGGLIAYEMACRLREAGEDVDMLALFETDVCYRNLLFREWLAHAGNLAGRVAHKLTILSPREWPVYLASKVQMIWRRLFLRLESRDPIPPSQVLPERIRARNCELYRSCVREYLAWRPRRFGGRITVFRTAEPAFDSCDPLPLWRRLGEAVDVFTVDGTHGTIMDEANVAGLALMLSNCLARADAGLAAPGAPAAIARARIAPGTESTDEFHALAEPDFAH